MAFLFAYSSRERTPAARRLEDDVPTDIKKKRLQELIDALDGPRSAEGERVGKIHLVLVEGVPRPRVQIWCQVETTATACTSFLRLYHGRLHRATSRTCRRPRRGRHVNWRGCGRAAGDRPLVDADRRGVPGRRADGRGALGRGRPSWRFHARPPPVATRAFSTMATAEDASKRSGGHVADGPRCSQGRDGPGRAGRFPRGVEARASRRLRRRTRGRGLCGAGRGLRRLRAERRQIRHQPGGVPGRRADDGGVDVGRRGGGGAAA